MGCIAHRLLGQGKVRGEERAPLTFPWPGRSAMQPIRQSMYEVFYRKEDREKKSGVAVQNLILFLRGSWKG